MDMLTMQDVAELIGVKRGTLDTYRTRGIVPDPDGYLGRTPWWRRATIEEWQKGRRKLASPSSRAPHES